MPAVFQKSRFVIEHHPDLGMHNDLQHFSDWLGKFLGNRSVSTAEAVTTLLGKPQGEVNEIVRAYSSAMIERAAHGAHSRLKGQLPHSKAQMVTVTVYLG